MAHQGFDYLCVDTQHGLIGPDRMPDLVRAIGLRGVIPFVRVPSNNPADIMKALDAGARAVVVPLVNNQAEAQRAAEACRYPPTGTRSFGPIRARYSQGPSLDELNNVACIVQVETAAGMDNVEAIAATPGVDGIYIGPSDLALAYGESPSHPDCHKSMATRIERIRKVCADNNIASGIHCIEGNMSARYRRAGFELITVLVDSVHAARTASAELRLAREA
ncbi:MAG: aldolase/citrate lyase family protein [Bosea sp.]|nr:aldolase/citrate lyase family protein [Bosea sp. (in: a-proteobacteria)]